MGQNDLYMNQDRETKEKKTGRKERDMGMFRVSKKKTVVLSFKILFCLQKSVFPPPPSTSRCLSCWLGS